MSMPTNYKRTFSQSIGSGMQSVMGGNGRRYYILEHRITSKYHKAGESQKIIIDQIEIGRDPKCQVRFDESFATVSRRHAAIIREGDNWKLVQLSQTNTTYLNGVSVNKEWYLQSGDEIQLSTNGPKLSFIVPQGDKSLVSSIGMTARLNLFRQQAMRPYKNVIAALAAVIALCIIAGAIIIYMQRDELSQMHRTLATTTQEFNDQMQQMQQRRMQDSLDNARRIAEDREQYRQQIEQMQQRNRQRGFSVAQLIQQQHVEESVYYLWTDKITLTYKGEEKEIPCDGWSGTGFLLADGRFVTARHCVEGWLYTDPTEDNKLTLAAGLVANSNQFKIKAYIYAMSSAGDAFEFTSDDFTIDRSLDRVQQLGNDEDGNAVYWRFVWPIADDWNPAMYATDWAYVKTSKHGKINIDKQLSKNLLPMQELIAFGFPQDLGVLDSNNSIVQPISNQMKVSRKGLAANGCIMHSSGVDHGNSGGPIFTIDDNDKLVCVGIVSRFDDQTTEHDWSVPVCQLK